MGKIIAFSNRKGGVGKTTSAEQTADLCSNTSYGFGLKTLCIDLDPQGSLTNSYKQDGKDGVYDLIVNSMDTRIKINDSLDFITSCNLGKLENELGSEPFSEMALADAIHNYEDEYDVIIIDCPPEDDWLNNCAYATADKLIIPVTADRYSVEGVVELSKRVSAIKRINKDISFGGLLLMKVNKRTNAYKDALADTRDCATILHTKVFESSISLSTVADDAQKAYETIYAYAPKSTLAKEYLDFVWELIQDLYSKDTALPSFASCIVQKMLIQARQHNQKSSFLNAIGLGDDEKFDWISCNANEDTLNALYGTNYMKLLQGMLDCAWLLSASGKEYAQ